MNRKTKKKILFFGDSLTQYGELPGGYIDLLNKKIIDNNLEKRYEITGAGISGNTVYNLYMRMEADVLSKDPDIVVIWIGVNDIWHKLSTGMGTEVAEFEKIYTTIIKELKSKNIEVVLVTPAVIGERYDSSNLQDADLDIYCGIVQKLAKQQDCELCDLRKIFIDYEKANNSHNAEYGILTRDGVHLNNIGNLLVADTFFSFLIK
jgi:lysophospholipase L1-like esterase